MFHIFWHTLGTVTSTNPIAVEWLKQFEYRCSVTLEHLSLTGSNKSRHSLPAIFIRKQSSCITNLCIKSTGLGWAFIKFCILWKAGLWLNLWRLFFQMTLELFADTAWANIVHGIVAITIGDIWVLCRNANMRFCKNVELPKKPHIGYHFRHKLNLSKIQTSYRRQSTKNPPSIEISFRNKRKVAELFTKYNRYFGFFKKSVFCHAGQQRSLRDQSAKQLQQSFDNCTISDLLFGCGTTREAFKYSKTWPTQFLTIFNTKFIHRKAYSVVFFFIVLSGLNVELFNTYQFGGLIIFNEDWLGRVAIYLFLYKSKKLFFLFNLFARRLDAPPHS